MEAKKKTYIKSFCIKKKFDNGGEIVKISILRDDFLKHQANDKGWVKLVLAERKQVGEKGDTHYLYIDDFVPKAKTPSESNDLPF